VEFVIELARAAAGGDSWARDARVSMSARGGLLTVTQTAAVHEELGAFLLRLRAMR
jgi:hypothetical protein